MRILRLKNLLICLPFVGFMAAAFAQNKSLETLLSDWEQRVKKSGGYGWLAPVDMTKGYFFDPGVHGLKAGGQDVVPQVSQDAQDLTDALTEELFKTPFGQGICSIIFGGDAAKVQHYLGVSEGVSKKITRCQANLNARLSLGQGDRGVSHAHAMTYLLIPGNSENFEDGEKYTSYSYTAGFTTFFLRKQDLGKERLLLALAHEIAMLFDTFQHVGPYATSQMNDLIADHPNLYKLPSLFRWQSADLVGDGYTMTQATSNPEVAEGFAIMRAIEVEWEVFKSLPKPSFRMRRKFDGYYAMSCMDRLKMAVDSQKFRRLDIWRQRGMAGYDIWYGLEPRLKDETQEQYLERRLQWAYDNLDAGQIEVSGKVQPACEYYSKARLGTDFIRLSSGPRPRWDEW